MINATNNAVQTVNVGQNVLFNSANVITPSSEGGCRGWLNHNEGSGLFEITKPGIYEIKFNANVEPTVAGVITFNITNSGENILGGEMVTPGATLEEPENISSSILVEVPCNCCDTFTVKNNSENPVIVDVSPSLTITRLP